MKYPDTGEVYKVCETYYPVEGEDAFVSIPFEGGEPNVIAQYEHAYYPKYSPDGKWILYWGKSSRWYLYNVETSENVHLVDPNCDPRFFRMGNDAQWSGDGSKVYYFLKDLAKVMRSSIGGWSKK